MSKINVAIVGGSGFWSELSHHKHLVGIRNDFDVRLAAVVDPVDPRSVPRHKNLQTMLQHDKTAWVNPDDYSDTDTIIQHLVDTYAVNLVIIASTPCTHYEYGMSTIKFRINTICDKPIISHRNASTDPSAAESIISQYDTLLDAYQQAKKDTPTLLFHSILRRRSLNTFIKVAEDLKDVYDQTGAGVNNMSIIVNGGKYKFPAELDKPGAHGYLEGVGSISHSAYHYLDIMSWYLDVAPGQAHYIRPRLNYAFRISDYLKAGSYTSLANVIDEDSTALTVPSLSKETLGCELNAGFTFDLLDENHNIIGSNSFLFNLVSFSPRTRKFDKNVHEPADFKDGGRMSHIIMDIHQDGLQSWQITKNNIVFEEDSINATRRLHPSLGDTTYESITDENAYASGISLEDLLRTAVEATINNDTISNHPNIRALDEERLAMQLYGNCYLLLANNYMNNDDQSAIISIQEDS